MADVVIIIASAVAADRMRWGSYRLGYGEWLQIVLACTVAANAFAYMAVYSLASMRHRINHLGRVGAAWAGTVLAVVAVIYFAKMAEEYSRGWILLWALTGYLGLIAVRTAAWAALSSQRGNGRLVLNIAVVGDGGAAESLARCIEDNAGGYVRIIGVFSPGIDARTGTPGIDDLVQLARCIRIDEIAVSFPCLEGDKIGVALCKLGTMPADVNLFPEIPTTPGLAGLMNARAPLVPLIRRPLAGFRMVSKRSVDIVLSTTALLFFGPIMLLVALLVRLDSPGPALFRQQRFGFNKKPITVYKFRTMYQEAALDSSAPQARRADGRVTRIGRFLRRTSLDELPQLLNVLNGSMSLVGPRPHPTALDDRYANLIDRYLCRLRVRPGITGWAQVNGLRGETDTVDKMERRVQCDLYYIEHCSLLFDLYILFLTIFVGFRHPNAY